MPPSAHAWSHARGSPGVPLPRSSAKVGQRGSAHCRQRGAASPAASCRPPIELPCLHGGPAALLQHAGWSGRPRLTRIPGGLHAAAAAPEQVDLLNRSYYPTSADAANVNKRWFVIDAEGKTLGRLASLAATYIRCVVALALQKSSSRGSHMDRAHSTGPRPDGSFVCAGARTSPRTRRRRTRART